MSKHTPSLRVECCPKCRSTFVASSASHVVFYEGFGRFRVCPPCGREEERVAKARRDEVRTFYPRVFGLEFRDVANPETGP